MKSVSELLGSFDAEFGEVATAFARGEYLLWIGSGISREVVPDVLDLLKGLLDFLQARIDQADPACRFRRALDEVLDFAQLPSAERAAVPFDVAVTTWTNLDQITKNLQNHYAEVLDVQVDGELADFLVWTGLDVPATYGAADLEPDVEHLCVAVLMEEGVVVAAPTTNWDALVETAVRRLSGDSDLVLNVIVRSQDFNAPHHRSELIKFHGCARRAAENEADYRSLLIARRSQIAGWTALPSNQMMKQRLEYLFASRPALIVGLSAQDANIHTVLFQASANLEREWPSSPPAVVVAEPALHHHHKLVLQATYGPVTYSANSVAIRESAVLGAYARPVLIALVLFTLADKLCALVGEVPELVIPPDDLQRIREDLSGLRDLVGAEAEAAPLDVVNALIASSATALGLFRHGQVPAEDSLLYSPLSIAPIGEALGNPDFPAPALGRLALALALLSRGHLANQWAMRPGERITPVEASVHVEHGGRQSRVFIVRDFRGFNQLEIDGVIDARDDATLVIQAEGTVSRSARSSGGSYGRSGRTGLRHVDLEELCASESTGDALYEAFTLECAL